MFNYQIDNSFYDYLGEIKPDLAIIQEARFKKLDHKNYSFIVPKGYNSSKIDSRIHLTVALYKQGLTREDTVDFGENNYRYIELKMEGMSFLGVHIPKIEEFSVVERIKGLCNTDIVCGDFNASLKNKESYNYSLYKQLINSEYCDLWENGLRDNNAYYLNFKGFECKATKDSFFRTYSGNTHIDYVLGKPTLKINKIIIDFRTLAFTDHCGIIVDILKK